MTAMLDLMFQTNSREVEAIIGHPDNHVFDRFRRTLVRLKPFSVHRFMFLTVVSDELS